MILGLPMAATLPGQTQQAQAKAPGDVDNQPEIATESVLPTLGTEDDASKSLPPDASGWQKFRHNPVVKRTGRVLLALAIGAIVLLVINLTMVPRDVKCSSPEDCRKIRRLNTILLAVRSILNLIIGFVLFFIVLGAMGVNTKALLATAGIIGIVVGLGAQPAIKSFIAGLQLVIGDRFSIGDYIMLDLSGSENVKGIVVDFGAQTTTLQDFSGAKYYVPNGNINVVINYSQNDQRAQVELQISYRGDIDNVLAEIQELNTVLATAEPLRGKVNRPPVLKGVTANGPYSYTVAVAAIAEPMAQIFVERYLRYQLLRLMQRMGVEASAITYVKSPLTGALTREVTDEAIPPEPLPTLAPLNVNEEEDDITDVTPETERGDFTVRLPRLEARTMRHDTDAIVDGSISRRAIRHGQSPLTGTTRSSDVDMFNLDEFQE